MNNQSSMILSIDKLTAIDGKKIDLPEQRIFSLPEKVLQFGTGVFIRSFADYFIDKANRNNVFNGRVVVVKSTDNGNTDEFDRQDALYTTCIKGLLDGNAIEDYIVNASISRVLTARKQWDSILACARSADMSIVISNTTEVGIQLIKEKLTTEAPVSFPGKLLAFLLERYHHFNGDEKSGMVILPTELISDNGVKLKEIVLELARFNELDENVLHWIENHNFFCNSLVDRIVPGKPAADNCKELYQQIGYEDHLISECEPFSLWAIEGDNAIREKLSFAKANPEIVIDKDIQTYRELKLRLLNGTHTLNCGLAFLAGIQLTRDAVNHPEYKKFMLAMMQHEIATAIPCEIDASLKADYVEKVLERFANPFINHQWISISAQFSFKLKTRTLPLLKNYFNLFNDVPQLMAAGFAGYLLFMKPHKEENGKFYGMSGGHEYPINDDAAATLAQHWQHEHAADVVMAVMKDDSLWGKSLHALNGWSDTVTNILTSMQQKGVMTVLNDLEKEVSAI